MVKDRCQATRLLDTSFTERPRRRRPDRLVCTVQMPASQFTGRVVLRSDLGEQRVSEVPHMVSNASVKQHFESCFAPIARPNSRIPLHRHYCLSKGYCRNRELELDQGSHMQRCGQALETS